MSQKYLNKLRIKQSKVFPKLPNPVCIKSNSSVKKLKDSYKPRSLSISNIVEVSLLTPFKPKIQKIEKMQTEQYKKKRSYLLEKLLL